MLLAQRAHPPIEERPCACIESFDYISFLVEEDGEEVEVFETVSWPKRPSDAWGYRYPPTNWWTT
jgi:hypothetical protein